jgi:hypothetical protein
MSDRRQLTVERDEYGDGGGGKHTSVDLSQEKEKKDGHSDEI